MPIQLFQKSSAVPPSMNQLKLHVIVILCLLTGNVLLQIVDISLPAVRQMAKSGHQNIARPHALENEIKSTAVYTI